MEQKEKRYQIELTETQLGVINEALDSYSRICCGQFDSWHIWESIRELKDKHKSAYAGLDVDTFENDIKAVQIKHLGLRGASYNATTFIGNCYAMYKVFKHHLYKERGCKHWGVDSDPNILPSGNQPQPTIKTIEL